MELYFKAAAGILIAVILSLVLSKQNKDISLLLTVAVCCMAAAIVVGYLEPVVDFFHQLEAIGQLEEGMLEILLKAVGIGMIGELASLICADAGNGSLGKVLQMLSVAVILWMSLPLLTGLLELIQKILGEI